MGFAYDSLHLISAANPKFYIIEKCIANLEDEYIIRPFRYISEINIVLFQNT